MSEERSGGSMPPATINGVPCNTPEGEALMAESEAKRTAEHDREMAEYEASLPTDEEMIAEAIKAAREAGVSDARIEQVIRRYAMPADNFTAIIASARLRDIARGRYGSDLH